MHKSIKNQLVQVFVNVCQEVSRICAEMCGFSKNQGFIAKKWLSDMDSNHD